MRVDYFKPPDFSIVPNAGTHKIFHDTVTPNPRLP